MNDTTKLRLTFRLSSTLGDVLSMLLTEDIVTVDDMKAVCTNPRVIVYRLRLALRPVGITIQVRRDLGYWLTKEDKQLIADVAEISITPESNKTEGELENGVSA